MEYQEFSQFLEHVGKDPSKLIFEDELTGLYNRRYLHHHLQFKIPWNSEEGQWLSLLMMDVDHFKEINDTYGHQVGDAALEWVARLIKDLVGDQGIPIRYAGDEFMILLPYHDTESSVKITERLIERIRIESFHVEEVNEAIPITLSIGVATTPMNPQGGKGLIHKADAALYYAKKKGRDRFAVESEIGLEDVFEKTAIHQFKDIKIVGRQKQLEQLRDALNKFSKRQNQFLIIEGTPGMGKSEFLEAICQNLLQSNVFQVKSMGIPQEMYRPYYIMTNILISILNQREDKGKKVLDALSPKEITYISQLLPYLEDNAKDALNEDEKEQREGLFNTLIRFIPKIVNHRPLILLIDDLDYCDEATLFLFRHLMLNQEIPLLICGTTSESKESKRKKQKNAFERFYDTYQKELDIKKLTLTPLTAEDISTHIQGIFTNARLPENFEKELERVTQGNPLFLGEILRKLVQDQKITLVGHQWVVHALDEGYLPNSLDDIVTQKIAALDEENRQLLEHISALGEDVSLSMIIGSSGKMESKVLEFIDQAVAQGLLNADFQINDENISFLSKRILDITYGSIDKNRKKKMHESIGDYQEALYEKNLLPSAATLAYHFIRSSDQERARKYEELMASSNNKIFDAAEAKDYEHNVSGEPAVEVIPLDDESIHRLPTVIRHLMTALRNIKLYPKESQPVTNAIQKLKESIDQIFENNEIFSIGLQEQILLVNDQEVDVSEFKAASKELIKLFQQLELKTILFHTGIPEDELETLLVAVNNVKSNMIVSDFWKRFTAEHNLNHINFEQVHYTLTEGQDAIEQQENAVGTDSEDMFSQFQSVDQKLNQEELLQVSEIIRDLLRASKNIKLYPIESKAIQDAIEQLVQSLEKILKKQPAFSLALVSNVLLFNGMKLDTSEFKTLATSFTEFLEDYKINSLTFLKNITQDELKTFIGELAQISDTQLEDDFWEHFAQDKGLSRIIFNRHLYEILDGIGIGVEIPQEESDTARQEEEKLEQIQEEIKEEEEDEDFQPLDKNAFKSFLKDIEHQLSDIVLKDDRKNIKKMLKKLFWEYETREQAIRQNVIEICQSTLDSLALATQHRFSKLLAEPLLDALSKESEAGILLKTASLLKNLVSILLQFTEYPEISNILFHLQRTHQKLIEANNEHAATFLKTFHIDLEPETQRLLLEDLKSKDPDRQEKAAQLMGSLGKAVTPLLVDIIKGEEDYRLRRLAISLIKENGQETIHIFKQELRLEVKPEERVRILEVIDSLDADLRDDLTMVLGDKNLQVRRAAFQLAERLNEQYVVDILLEYAKNPEINIATEAIRCLGKIKQQSAGGGLVSLLYSMKEEERLIACCRALGQIKDPMNINPLIDILTPKGFFCFQKKHSSHVRAAAASAIAQISDPRSTQILASFLADSDPRIRQIAKNALNKSKPSVQTVS